MRYRRTISQTMEDELRWTVAASGKKTREGGGEMVSNWHSALLSTGYGG